MVERAHSARPRRLKKIRNECSAAADPDAITANSAAALAGGREFDIIATRRLKRSRSALRHAVDPLIVREALLRGKYREARHIRVSASGPRRRGEFLAAGSRDKAPSPRPDWPPQPRRQRRSRRRFEVAFDSIVEYGSTSDRKR